MIEAINRICARPAREQRPANYRMRTTGDCGQSKCADATKALNRPATPRPHAHWHVDVATGRLECRWCLEDDISGESSWQQFGLVLAVYQMNRVMTWDRQTMVAICMAET